MTLQTSIAATTDTPAARTMRERIKEQADRQRARFSEMSPEERAERDKRRRARIEADRAWCEARDKELRTRFPRTGVFTPSRPDLTPSS